MHHVRCFFLVLLRRWIDITGWLWGWTCFFVAVFDLSFFYLPSLQMLQDIRPFSYTSQGLPTSHSCLKALMTIYIFLDLDCPRSSTLALALLVGILLLTVSALSLSLLSPHLSFSPSSVSLFFLFHNKVIHGECFFFDVIVGVVLFFEQTDELVYSTRISRNFRIYTGQLLHFHRQVIPPGR